MYPNAKRLKNKTIGMVVQKIILVDCFTIFFNPLMSFLEWNSANFGVAMLFIANKTITANVECLNATPYIPTSSGVAKIPSIN